ncbi:MAG: apolipoprotein N-acyltransferase [Candidatus Omnitrophica bacterium]|nr:apolipoprotein N-acyltransferase [Candidatus Omnitrophota bacterium]
MPRFTGQAGLNLSFLEWFALVPWFLAIRGKRALYSFFLSLWMGILFWGITLFWLRLVTGLGFFLLLPYLGLYFAVFGWGLSQIYGRSRRIGTVPGFQILIPLVWVLLERLRGVLLGGFPWLSLSHGQYLNIPLLQWASLAGEGIISGIIILVNLIIMAIFLSRGKKRIFLAIALFLIILSVHVGGKILLKREADKQETLRVAVIQPNIIEKWDKDSMEENFNILMGLNCESLKERPQFIIWPESSFSSDLEKDRLHLEQLKGFAREHNLYLLVGAIKEVAQGEFYNRAILISPGDEISSYDKVRLVPFGEYVPLGEKFPRWERWVEDIAGYRFSFVPGKEQNILSIDSTPFGVLICFEDIFPGLSRRFKEKGARLLINITDDHWFGRGPAPYQHLAASVLRAVENRLPVVRSANTGISAFIDSSGRIINMVEKEGHAIFVRGVSVQEISF